MNVFTLTIVLLFFFFIAFFVDMKNLISPTLWMVMMFLLACIGYLLNMEYFGMDISMQTVWVILLSLLTGWMGEISAKHIKVSVKKKIKLDSKMKLIQQEMKILQPGKYVVLFSALFVLFLGIYRYLEMYSFTRKRGNTRFFMTVKFIRGYVTVGDFDFNGYITLLSGLADAIAFISLYYAVMRLIVKKEKSYFNFLPSICYLVYLISTTGRTGYLKFFIFLIAIIYFAILRSGRLTKKSIYKFIKYMIIVCFIMIAVFYLYGVIFRKADETLPKYFGDYFSAGMYGLNKYLNSPWKQNVQFGQYTLANFYYYINRIFKTRYVVAAHHLPFFYYGLDRSNIYTGYLLPIQDYGMIGLLISRYFIAMIMTGLYKAIKNGNTSNQAVQTIIYGYFLYICFSIVIADRFKELLTVTSFPSFLFFLYFVNWIYRKYGETEEK